MKAVDLTMGFLYNLVSANDSDNGTANSSQEPMTHRITMTEVARRAGVSLMTVSRVVNNKEDVSESTRQRVLKIIEDSGFRPSSIARSLVTQRTGTLGLVVPDIDNPFFSGLVSGVESQAYSNGYNVFLCNTNEDAQREQSILVSLEEKMIDGLILCSSRLPDEELRAAAERFPAVVIISRQLPGAGLGTALIDDRLGGNLAVTHLLRTGRRRIGLITGPAISFSSQGRLSGYRQALEDAGIPFRDQLVYRCRPVQEEAAQAVRHLLSICPNLDGLFCHNDLVAVGALQALKQYGICVPDDVAVVGYDDIPIAAWVTPALTTCRVERFELGSQAMRLLLERIRNSNHQEREVVVSPRLVVRQSAPE